MSWEDYTIAMTVADGLWSALADGQGIVSKYSMDGRVGSWVKSLMRS
jgi:hypothetical protein